MRRQSKVGALESLAAEAMNRVKAAEAKQAEAERLAAAAWERVDELRRIERNGQGPAPRVVIDLTVNDGGAVTFNGTAHSGR